MAVRELARFHIDTSKYSLSNVEHDAGSSTLLTFDGQSEGNVFPQAQVLFTKMPRDWDIRVDLTFNAKVREPGLVLTL